MRSPFAGGERPWAGVEVRMCVNLMGLSTSAAVACGRGHVLGLARNLRRSYTHEGHA